MYYMCEHIFCGAGGGRQEFAGARRGEGEGRVTNKARLSVPRRPICPEAGIYPEAGLSVPRRVYQSRGEPLDPKGGCIRPEAGP